MATSLPIPAQPTRRWHHFRVRSLLLLTLIVSLPLAWPRYQRRQIEIRRETCEKLLDFGARFTYDDVHTPRPPWVEAVLGDERFENATGLTWGHDRIVLQDRPTLDDEIFQYILVLSQLRRLSLENMHIGDAELARLGSMTGLESLKLGYTLVTDRGIAHLLRMPRLAELVLRDTAITDAGLAHLAKMQHLKWLDLANTQVSDEGLACLGGLTELRWLRLTHTQVSDGGLVYLRGLKQLEMVQLNDTFVTDAGIESLRLALPHLFHISR